MGARCSAQQARQKQYGNTDQRNHQIGIVNAEDLSASVDHSGGERGGTDPRCQEGAGDSASYHAPAEVPQASLDGGSEHRPGAMSRNVRLIAMRTQR